MATSLLDAPKLLMSATLWWLERVRYVDDEGGVDTVRRPGSMANDQDSYDRKAIIWHHRIIPSFQGERRTFLYVTYSIYLQGGAAHGF